MERDEQALAELQARQGSLAESMGKLRQTLEALEGKMTGQTAQDGPSVQSTAGDSSNEQAFKDALISEEPYPEQRLAGFVPLKVLSEERERLVGHIQTVRDSEFLMPSGIWKLIQTSKTAVMLKIRPCITFCLVALKADTQARCSTQ